MAVGAPDCAFAFRQRHTWDDGKEATRRFTCLAPGHNGRWLPHHGCSLKPGISRL